MNQEKLSVALEQVNEIARYAAQGNETMAQDARRTLDELCWSAEGYPAAVARALDAKGLRSTAS
jgi:hypothetical protein